MSENYAMEFPSVVRWQQLRDQNGQRNTLLTNSTLVNGK